MFSFFSLFPKYIDNKTYLEIFLDKFVVLADSHYSKIRRRVGNEMQLFFLKNYIIVQLSEVLGNISIHISVKQY